MQIKEAGFGAGFTKHFAANSYKRQQTQPDKRPFIHITYASGIYQHRRVKALPPVFIFIVNI